MKMLALHGFTSEKLGFSTSSTVSPIDHGKWAKIWVNSSGWIVEHCTPGLILHLDLQESVDLFGGCDHYSNFRCFRRNQRGYDRDMTVNNQMAALVHHTCLIFACRILGENLANIVVSLSLTH